MCRGSLFVPRVNENIPSKNTILPTMSKYRYRKNVPWIDSIPNPHTSMLYLRAVKESLSAFPWRKGKAICSVSHNFPLSLPGAFRFTFVCSHVTSKSTAFRSLKRRLADTIVEL